MKIKNIILSIMCLFIPFSSCKKNDDKLVIAEVTHSLFYAPMYVALEKGYFKDQGLDIEIITTPGADKVMASLLSKSASIGLMGPEASVYVYQNGQEDYAINFAQLTKKDGSFLLGRDKVKEFSYDMLKGKTIIGGRKGGMPEMTLEYVLKKAGLSISNDMNDTSKDVIVRTDVSFEATSGIFVSGESDFVTAFEPTASQIESSKKGYIVASIGELLNEDVPYTCFSCLKSYLSKNEDKLIKFTKGLVAGLDYVNNHKSEDIILYLRKSFASSSDKELISVINNYKKISAWVDEMLFKESQFNKLLDIIRESNELSQEEVPYDKLVTNKIINAI